MYRMLKMKTYILGVRWEWSVSVVILNGESIYWKMLEVTVDINNWEPDDWFVPLNYSFDAYEEFYHPDQISPAFW